MESKISTTANISSKDIPNEKSYDLSDLEEEENSWILTAQQDRIQEAHQNENVLPLFKFNSNNNQHHNQYHCLIQDSSSDISSSESSISLSNKSYLI